MKTPEWKTITDGIHRQEYFINDASCGGIAQVGGRWYAKIFIDNSQQVTSTSEQEVKAYVEDAIKAWCANYLAAAGCAPTMRVHRTEAQAKAAGAAFIPTPPDWVIGGKYKTRGGRDATVVAFDATEKTVTYEVQFDDDGIIAKAHITVGIDGRYQRGDRAGDFDFADLLYTTTPEPTP